MSSTNPLSYNAFVTQLGVMSVLQTQETAGVVSGVDSYFNAQFIAQALNYAELRIQRDLDLLPSKTSNTYTLDALSNTIAVPTGDFVTLLNVTYTLSGVSQPLTPVSQEFIQNVYNSSASNGPPQYFAMIGGDRSTGGATSNNVLFGPSADQNYSMTVFGTIRMPSLATYATSGPADSSYTFISTWLPDLLLQASMIFVAEFQRNFAAAGTMSNEPLMAGTYEAAYQGLLKGALSENVRAKFWGAGWSSEPPSPVATPNR